MAVTSSRLSLPAGFSALVFGALCVAIKLIHPEESVAAVSGTFWSVVAWMSGAMAFLVLVGISGIYLRRVREAGDCTTVLDGPLADEAALHGLLQRVRDPALPLLSVTPVTAYSPATSTAESEAATSMPTETTGSSA